MKENIVKQIGKLSIITEVVGTTKICIRELKDTTWTFKLISRKFTYNAMSKAVKGKHTNNSTQKHEHYQNIGRS